MGGMGQNDPASGGGGLWGEALHKPGDEKVAAAEMQSCADL